MPFTQEDIIEMITRDMERLFEYERSGHDCWHLKRVSNIAKHIAREERANIFVVEVAALLHDIADWKFHNGDEDAGPKAARKLCEQCRISSEDTEHICDIVATLSFKGAHVPAIEMRTLEGKIVQDADRLDAMGAIGIARTFTYGGHMGRAIYDPNIKPVMHTTKEAYRNSDAPTLNHFYEKLLLLRDRMNTATGKRLAEGRHAVMEQYLQQFFLEWNGEL